MNDDSSSSNNSNSNNNNHSSAATNSNNWLGFSLSPHMKMEVTNASETQQQHPHQQQFAQSFYLSSSPTTMNVSTASALCYENNPFHSSLSVMPLKSDGSLCIMEALSRSHADGKFSLI